MKNGFSANQYLTCSDTALFTNLIEQVAAVTLFCNFNKYTILFLAFMKCLRALNMRNSSTL
jgi:hypothetical protein